MCLTTTISAVTDIYIQNAVGGLSRLVNVSGSTDETNQINTLPPVVSGRAESFLVFHGFPPSPLYDGSEWTSMAPKTKCQKDVYCTVYPSLILPAIPFSLCTIPFSFLCVCVFLSLHVSPAFLVFSSSFFFFYLPLSICLFFLSFSGHADDTGLGQTK